MDLLTYTSTQTTVGAFAKLIDVPSPLVSQWRTGVRPVPLERCTAIEQATGGEVRRWDLRPNDWGAIWPELIGAEGAPAWPAEEVQAA
jgi:DNA-binding transcriptional regulator YdaS (Cro superfamily)